MKVYEVQINGVTTNLKLSDEDAKARGLKPADEVKSKEAKAAANKAAPKPANKSASQSKRDELVGRAMNAPKKASAES